MHDSPQPKINTKTTAKVVGQLQDLKRDLKHINGQPAPIRSVGTDAPDANGADRTKSAFLTIRARKMAQRLAAHSSRNGRVGTRAQKLPVKSRKTAATRGRTVVSGSSSEQRGKSRAARGAPPAAALTRSYVTKAGKLVKTAEMVPDTTAFNRRLKEVRDPNFASKAVGVAESMIYHGSKTMQHDFVRDGVSGTRICGSQFLDSVATVNNNFLGQRLTAVLVNPTALGSILAKLAALFEQSKVNHMRVLYKPVVPTTTAGALAMYFRNDVSSPSIQVGIDELQHAATHTAFADFTVWSPSSIEIKPSDVALKYWDEMTGDFANDVQGLITIIASSDLAANTVYGHLYLEYDVEFFSPELDYEVDEIGIFNIELDWVDAETTADNPIRFVFDAVSAARVGWVESDPPTSSEYLLYGVLVNWTGVPPYFCSHSETSAESFNPGQLMFFRLVGISGNWEDGSMQLIPFLDVNSASGSVTFDGHDDVADGQLLYYDTHGEGQEVSGSVTFRCRLIPLGTGH